MDKQYRIFVLLSGGTICTSAHSENRNKIRRIDSAMPSLLEEQYCGSSSFYADKISFSYSPNFGILSENMTVDCWNRLLSYVSDHLLEIQSFDGLIIAHGTDTLAYTAALFALLLQELGIPVFIVSSDQPLSYPDANGFANFALAADLICSGIKPDVYVPYRNPSNGEMLLHLASHLSSCSSYSNDFNSPDSIRVHGQDYRNCIFPARENKPFPVRLSDHIRLEDCVLHLFPYVGLNYDAFDFSRYKAILHETYHSGTVCVSTDNDRHSVLYLLEKCSGGPDVYFNPMNLDVDLYASVAELTESKAHFRPLYGYTNEMAYVKLLVAYSTHTYSNADLDTFMSTSYCGEIFGKD